MFPVKYIYIILGFLALIFGANVLLLDFFFVKQKNDLLDFQTRLTQLGSRAGTTTILSADRGALSAEKFLALDACPQSCISIINTATKSAAVIRVPTVVPTPAVTSQPQTPKGEYFVPLGSGSVLSSEATSSNWKTIDAAQATFDAGNYGATKAAYFEVFIRTQTNGEVHARLLDSTTPALFFNSDLKTTSTNATFLSAPISLSSGVKTYKVQMYSTLSTGYLDQARIRIVTQ